jgi:hypothetical protein
MFDLKLDRRGRLNDASGELIIGAFSHEFLIDLSHWSAADYWASWLRSAAHLMQFGYGRFLLSVTAPGGMYETWPCWVKDDRAVFHKAIVLGSITGDFSSPQEAETPPEDYVERGQLRESVRYYSCALTDIAEFERRMRKGQVQ